MRSDVDHTVLPANYTIPAFTPQPQSITGLWLVFILLSHRVDMVSILYIWPVSFSPLALHHVADDTYNNNCVEAVHIS